MKRLISSIAALLLLFIAALTPPVFLKFAVFLVAQLMIYEYNRAFGKKGNIYLNAVGHIACFLVFFTEQIKDYYLIIIFILIITYAVISIIRYEEINIKDITISLFGVLYIVLLMSFIIMTRALINGKWHIWLIFTGAWTVDIFAFLTGSKFGRRKVVPKISPNKTIAGCIGGFLAGIIFIVLLGVFENYYINISIPVYHYAIMGLLCGFTSQAGDLFASVLKRQAKIKDFGKIMPGHGGVLDRLDSILFTAPVVYIYLKYVIIPIQ